MKGIIQYCHLHVKNSSLDWRIISGCLGFLICNMIFFGRFIIGSLSVFWVLWKHQNIVLFNDFIFLFYSESEPFINVSKRAFKIIRVQELHRKLFMHPQTCLRIKLKPLAYKSTNSRICSQLIKMHQWSIIWQQWIIKTDTAQLSVAIIIQMADYNVSFHF